MIMVTASSQHYNLQFMMKSTRFFYFSIILCAQKG